MAFKISFFTVCMDRAHHIKMTFLKNILDNADYDLCEFVLLDYGSRDGLSRYLEEELIPSIKGRNVKIYSIPDRLFFRRSHSRNVASSLCNGDIICNVDADNYTGPGFASFLNGKFEEEPNIYLSNISGDEVTGDRDTLGRIACKRSDFLNVGGYDEDFDSYGYEDYDLSIRLARKGLKRNPVPERFLSAIRHDDKERVGNEFSFKHLKRFLVKTYSAKTSEIMLLYKKETYDRVIIEKTRSDNNGPQSPLLGLTYFISLLHKNKYSLVYFEQGHWDCIVEEGGCVESLRVQPTSQNPRSLSLIRYEDFTSCEFLPQYLILISEIINKAKLLSKAQQNRSLNLAPFGRRDSRIEKRYSYEEQ